MKLLAVDSSAKSASVAIFEDKNLISECFVNNGLTHSKTLLSMVNNALNQSDLSIADIEKFAVNVGPGSFTGIRIGVAAIKGLAFNKNKPCAGISTLKSMAYNFIDEDCYVCCSMDARCNQVYCAVFEIENNFVKTVIEDKAVSIDDFYKDINLLNIKKIYLAGDGAKICFEKFNDSKLILPSENRLYQRAYGVGLAALYESEFTDSSLIEPVYLRLPQAERELKLKKNGD